MLLQHLSLENFRSHHKLTIDFTPDQPVTYIIGPNAHGKTNVLEAIYLLALTKSFRAKDAHDLIKWGSDFARVKAEFIDQNKSTQLEVFLGHAPNPAKVFKKNNVKTSASNFLGNFQVVFFHPEDLNMLYLGPDLRRAYLNTLNVQVDKNYFLALRNYQRVMKQRNALLHRIKENLASADDLDIWDDQLIEHGSYIMLERAKTIAYFRQNLQESYRQISQGEERVEIIYQHTLDLAGYHLSETSPLQDWQEAYAEAIQFYRHKDLISEHTLKGPHRDDLVFTLRDKPLQLHASRGEYRSLLLALKLLEIDFMRQKTHQKPILLLDDVFSELDLSRQKMLMEAIQSHQTIITTTESVDNTLLSALNPINHAKIDILNC